MVSLFRLRTITKNTDKGFAKLENFGPRDFYFQICGFCACKYNALVVNGVNTKEW